jgi:thioredoxin 1
MSKRSSYWIVGTGTSAVAVVALFAVAVCPSYCSFAGERDTHVRSTSYRFESHQPQNTNRGARIMSVVPETAQNVGKVEHATTKNFREKVLGAEDPVLVDFYADWCGPCRMLAPVLEEVARETPDARVVKVNVDHSPELAAHYQVSSIPSLMVFKEGRVTGRQVGLASKAQLKALLKR